MIEDVEKEISELKSELKESPYENRYDINFNDSF